MTSLLKTFLALVVITYASHAEAEIIRRAAFDFGSGKTKVQVADVDTDTCKILRSILTEDTPVLLSEAAIRDPNGLFNEEIQRQAIEAARALKQKALDLGAVSFSGLATEAYRKAPNGGMLIDQYLSELKIPVQIISQSEEGKMGFLSLIAETTLNPAQVVSWDIGGGSFQVTYLDGDENIQVYMAPFGRVTAKNAVIEHVKGGNPSKISSPNPMNPADWESALHAFSALLPNVPKELLIKLKQSDVRLIGISAHPERLRNLKTYHLFDIPPLLNDYLDKADEEILTVHKAPPLAIPELALVQSVMQKLGVTKVEYIRTNSGSTSALLTLENYWRP